MNNNYEQWYSMYRNKVESFWPTMNIKDDQKVEYLLSRLRQAVEQNDDEEIEVLVGAAYEIETEAVRILALNKLLLIDGHKSHQGITRELQLIGDPSSIDYIEKALELGFERFAYTSSEDEVIAKWFSHALADIGTPAAIAIIKKYASNTNQGIRSEMQYRLSKVPV